MALLDENKNNDGIIDLNIDGIKRTAFRINGNNDAILELNLSDVNIGKRLEKGYQQLHDEIVKISEIPDGDENLSEKLSEADKAMREYLDYIFDSNVSEVCGSGGSMYDLKDGEFRFEHIISALVKLYDENLKKEYDLMKLRLQKYTKGHVGTSKATKSRKKG